MLPSENGATGDPSSMTNNTSLRFSLNVEQIENLNQISYAVACITRKHKSLNLFNLFVKMSYNVVYRRHHARYKGLTLYLTCSVSRGWAMPCRRAVHSIGCHPNACDSKVSERPAFIAESSQHCTAEQFTFLISTLLLRSFMLQGYILKLPGNNYCLSHTKVSLTMLIN